MSTKDIVSFEQLGPGALIANVIVSVFELHEKMYRQICMQQCLGSDSLPTLT